MGTWHHPVTVLDAPASFAVLMWRDFTAGDEEFVDVKTPVTIVITLNGSQQSGASTASLRPPTLEAHTALRYRGESLCRTHSRAI